MERYEDKYDHRIYIHNLSSCEIKAWKKKSGLNGIRTHDLYDTGALPTELSTNCQLACQLPVRFNW